MARPPKKVSATSGQGVSRRSYQVSRSLGMKGTGSPGPSPLKNVSAESGTSTSKMSQSREYPKTGGFSYTEREMGNPNLKSLVGVGKRKSPRATKGFL